MSMLRNWNIMTGYDYMWYEDGIKTVLAGFEKLAFAKDEIISREESKDLHLAFDKFVGQKHDFRPTESTHIRIRGWAVLDGSGQTIYDENGNVGTTIMTSPVRSFFFKDGELYARTESGSTYILHGKSSGYGPVNIYNRRRLKMLSDQEVAEIANRYFAVAS